MDSNYNYLQALDVLDKATEASLEVMLAWTSAQEQACTAHFREQAARLAANTSEEASVAKAATTAYTKATADLNRVLTSCSMHVMRTLRGLCTSLRTRQLMVITY
jgi:hypothetical protein